MDTNSIMTTISTLGFPIVACCAMGWYVYVKDKMHTEEKEELVQAINRNTEIMIELKTILTK